MYFGRHLAAKKILQRPLFAQKLFYPTGKGSANPTNENSAVVIEGVFNIWNGFGLH